MTSSALCYTGRICQLTPIEGTDRIQLAEVDCGVGGVWRGVVSASEFPAEPEPRGVLATVFLMDAIVPPLPELAFLAKSVYRVKMSRFKGVPSECLIVPALTEDAEIGVDLTERLQVRKYEKSVPPQLGGLMEGAFPSTIPKTDETNGQKVRRRHFVPGRYVATLKYDGTSSTAYRLGDHFGVCSRHWELKEGDNVYWKIARRYRLAETLPDGIALQWETCGPKIGTNAHRLKEHEGFVFAAYDIARRAYLSVEETEELAARLAMPMVTRVADRVLEQLDVRALQDEVARLAVDDAGKPLEGLVYRAWANDADGAKRSFKLLHVDYKH
jgi:RNA ligase (TIGR02306 family)